MLAEHALFDASGPELGYSYVFPALDLSVWRPIVPERPEDPEGISFESIGIGESVYQDIINALANKGLQLPAGQPRTQTVKMNPPPRLRSRAAARPQLKPNVRPPRRGEDWVLAERVIEARG